MKSLWECLQAMPDPRSQRGRSYPMPGLLGMAMLGALHGERSLRGMWMWGCKHWGQIARPLGLLIGREHPPAYNTLWYLFRALHTPHLASLEAWMGARPGGEAEAISVNGKGLECSRHVGEERWASQRTHWWVSSLPPAPHRAEHVAQLLRDRWTIENGVFRVRDVAINLIRGAGYRCIPDGWRDIARRPDQGLSFLSEESML